jgi:cytochrome subunit of sulfide dehydrogenase
MSLLCGLLCAGALHAHGDGAKDALGRNLAATCANCHGTNGHSQGSVKALARVPAQDTIVKLTQFKEGKLPATIMHQIAKGFSDEQIKAIAEYFAHQK